jgi:hypothetical protein
MDGREGNARWSLPCVIRTAGEAPSPSFGATAETDPLAVGPGAGRLTAGRGGIDWIVPLACLPRILVFIPIHNNISSGSSHISLGVTGGQD